MESACSRSKRIVLNTLQASLALGLGDHFWKEPFVFDSSVES